MRRMATVLVATAGLLGYMAVGSAGPHAGAGGQHAGPGGAAVRTAALPEPLWWEGTGRAWRLWYPSTSWNGRPAVVSGTLAVRPAGHRPVAGRW